MSASIETEVQLNRKTIAELKSFLLRFDVAPQSVERVDGGVGNPRKADYVARAIAARKDYLSMIAEAQAPPAPNSPVRVNPFQSASTTPPKAENPASASASASDLPAPERTPSKIPDLQRSSIRPSMVSASKRRSSVGWLDPSLMMPPTPPRPPAPQPALQEPLEPESPPRPVETHFQAYSQAAEQEAGASDGGFISDGGDEVVMSGASDSEGASSTFATDDDASDSDGGAERAGRFDEMRVAELKEWLAKRKVPFIPRSKKATLVSLARAHQNYLETLIDEPPQPPAPPQPAPLPPVQELHYVAPTFRAPTAVTKVTVPEVIDLATTASPKLSIKKPRTAAPVSIDEGIMEDPTINLDASEDDVVLLSRRRTRKLEKYSRRGAEKSSAATTTRIEKPSRRSAPNPAARKSYPKLSASRSAGATARGGSKTLLPRFSIPRIEPMHVVRFIMGVIVFVLWLFLVLSLYQAYLHSKKPFCDTGADVLADGRECRPCPDHGTCTGGDVDCNPGFIRVDSRCARDQEVSLYADHLASRAAGILSSRAGRAECGESVKRAMSSRELRNLLEPASGQDMDNAKGKQTSRRRASRYDPGKFGPAFELALGLLDTPEPFGVVNEYGSYSAIRPRLPLSCVVRRFVFRYWRFFSTVFGTTVMYLYVSLKRKRATAKMRVVLEARDKALYALEDQAIQHRESVVNNFSTVAEDYVTDTHLRDEVLGSDVAALKLWQEVEVELKRDTRVSLSGREEHKGRPCYKWRWIGRQSFGAPSSRRTSFGSGAESIGEFAPGHTPGRSPGSEGRSVGRSSFGSAGSGSGFFGRLSGGSRTSPGSGMGGGSGYLSARPSLYGTRTRSPGGER